MTDQPYTNAFLWRAIYDDHGEDTLDEHDAEGTPHTFAEIDQARLRAFVLMPQRPELQPVALHLESGQRLIFFRRTNIDFNGPQAGIPRKAHVIGWQQTVKGTSVKSMLAVFDNGAALMVSDESLIEP